jgi:hypothetical protein
MTLRESVKIEIDALPEETLFTVRDFLLFQKYRAILEMDDTTYLNSLPGIMDSIRQGTETPVSECVALSEVWPDV